MAAHNDDKENSPPEPMARVLESVRTDLCDYLSPISSTRVCQSLFERLPCVCYGCERKAQEARYFIAQIENEITYLRATGSEKLTLNLRAIINNMIALHASCIQCKWQP